MGERGGERQPVTPVTRFGDLPPYSPRLAVDQLLPERFRGLLDSMRPEQSRVLVLGESGSGKLRLVEAAASELMRELQADTLIQLSTPRGHGLDGTSTLAAAFARELGVAWPQFRLASDESRPAALEIAEQLNEWISEASDGSDVLLVIPRLDEYGPADGYVLDLVLQNPGVRLVATAVQLAGPAGRIARNPGTATLAYGPLSLSEAERFLERSMRAERIEEASLNRWYETTRGNTFALGLLAFELEQTGALRRGHGAVWGVPALEPAPREFAQHIYDGRSERWRYTVEIIALTEPLFESPLLDLLDTECLVALAEGGMVVSKVLPDGEHALELSHPIVSAAVHDRISPAHRLLRLREISRALRDTGASAVSHTDPRRLLRVVRFALQAGEDLPIDFLWRAREMGPRLVAQRLLLGIDLAIGAHPEATLFQRGVGLLQSIRLARLLGDGGVVVNTGHLIEEMLDGGENLDALPAPLRAGLYAEMLAARASGTGWSQQLDTVYTTIEGSFAPEGPQNHDQHVAVAMLRGSRSLALASLGRLRQANEVLPDEIISEDLRLEWARLPGSTVRVLLEAQRGRFAEHSREVERLRWLATLGERPSVHLHDLQSLCWFLGHWLSGSWVTVEQIDGQFDSALPWAKDRGVTEDSLRILGLALFATQEGRWRDAAQLIESELDALVESDRHGIRALVEAAFALVLAVLGEETAALRALAAADSPTPGVAQMLSGVRRMLTLRALQWLNTAEALRAARECADWASGERLDLIELHALHVWAMHEPARASELYARALLLEATRESPVAELLAAHIAEIASGESPYSGPGARALGGVGIWLPLPETAQLTAREREVALLAALGYSSRWISARLHLSPRTVETHLGNIFGKTGVQDRDGLREWFAHSRRSTRSRIEAA